MGYYTKVSGILLTSWTPDRIKPENLKKVEEMRRLGFTVEGVNGTEELTDSFNEINYWVESIQVDSMGSSIAFEGNAKAYYLKDELQKCLDKAKDEHGITGISGDIYMEGEEFPDFHLMRVKDNVVTIYDGEVTIDFGEGGTFSGTEFTH